LVSGQRTDPRSEYVASVDLGLKPPGAGASVSETWRGRCALEQVNPDAARVVLMRVFGGLTVVEVAEVLEVSDTSVKRQWRFARAWLLKHMGEEER
jgi:DNA-directed RNA polymerase specialized sigma24 family protein